jgi:putative membrane protein
MSKFVLLYKPMQQLPISPTISKREKQMKKIAVLFAAAALSCAYSGIAPAQDSKPTDPQIAHIAYTAGQIDIAAAEQALKKSKNAQVRAFAEDMVRDHKSVNDQALALCKKLGVTPEDNATSKSMQKNGDAERAKLEGMTGAAFDREYAQNEVSYHHAVNSALENTLIASANNAELKNLLSTGLKIFRGHEEHARALVASLK